MEITSYLDELQITYSIYEHEPVKTMEDMADIIKNVEGSHFKNLFVRDQKGKNHYLCVIDEAREVSLSDLADVLDSGKLSFCSDKRLKKYLNLASGCVGPFGLINDSNHDVTLVLDNKIFESEIVNFHPNRNDAMLSISRESFLKYIDSLEYDYIKY